MQPFQKNILVTLDWQPRGKLWVKVPNTLGHIYTQKAAKKPLGQVPFFVNMQQHKSFHDFDLTFKTRCLSDSRNNLI